MDMGLQKDVNFMATELRLGLPGAHNFEYVKNNKRALSEEDSTSGTTSIGENESQPAQKAQIVGWPPVRSYRKNNIPPPKNTSAEGMYVKVSMDGAPYLRKIDLKAYDGYSELLNALETMFRFTIGEYSEREGYKGSEYAPAYEDKDGDLMLVGDVPWNMFITSCKRLRIIKPSEAGLC